MVIDILGHGKLTFFFFTVLAGFMNKLQQQKRVI